MENKLTYGFNLPVVFVVVACIGTLNSSIRNGEGVYTIILILALTLYTVLAVYEYRSEQFSSLKLFIVTTGHSAVLFLQMTFIYFICEWLYPWGAPIVIVVLFITYYVRKAFINKPIQK